MLSMLSILQIIYINTDLCILQPSLLKHVFLNNFIRDIRDDFDNDLLYLVLLTMAGVTIRST